MNRFAITCLTIFLCGCSNINSGDCILVSEFGSSVVDEAVFVSIEPPNLWYRVGDDLRVRAKVALTVIACDELKK